MSNDGVSTFSIHRNSTPMSPGEREEVLQNPAFGRVLTDHMTTIRYTEELGWHDPKIEPRADFKLDPSSLVFH
ncbi:Branched-chain-amino-acid aminotransferase [compost metagenome]